MQKIYWTHRIILLNICALSSFSVFGVGAQKDEDGNVCMYDFNFHNITTSSESETFCAKAFQDKVTWDEANALCRITYSYFTSRIHQNSSLHTELIQKGIDLLWVGIRRKAHFFVNESSSVLFEEKTRSATERWGAQWSSSEPRFNDCVALNLSTGELLTQQCSSRLPFVCYRGVPETGKTDQLLCPDKWTMSYPLSTSGKKCVSLRKAQSQKGAEEVCEDDDSRLATTLEYEILHDSGSFLPQSSEDTAYWANKENYGSCVFKVIPAINGTATVERPQNCSKQQPFVCVKEYEREDVKVWISPDIVPSFPSTSSCPNNPDRFSCNVKIDGRQVSSRNKQLLFQWYKDDLPLAEKNYVFRVSYLGDSMRRDRLITNAVTRQGSYHCEVRIRGSSKSYSSPKIDFFYSDIATYIIIIDGIAPRSIRDYSHQDFTKFLNHFGRSTMDVLLKELKYPSATWDFQSISVGEGVATMKILVYIHRNEFDDETTYQEVKTIFERHHSVFLHNGNVSVTINSADVCFGKEAKSIDTCESDVIWPTSKQTMNVVSDPMCLDGHKRIVPRKCKANIMNKAEWSAFSCSSCEIQQKRVQDMELQCSDGYTRLKSTNLCFKIYAEERNWHDANKICSENLSYILNEPYDDLDFHTNIWISFKYSHGKIQQVGRKPKNGNFSLENITGSQKPELHCVSVVLENGKYTMKLRNCNEKLAFVCLKNSFELVSSVKFSNTWTKLYAEKPCYYFSKNDMHKWKESMEECPKKFPNANLLKGIHNLKRYRYLKALMHQLFSESECHSISWWMDFQYEGEHSKNSLILSNWEYVDWSPYTNFNWKTASGTLTLFPNKEILWTLADPSSKFRYVCELEQCDDDRPTQAYIEHRSRDEIIIPAQNYSSHLENFILKCIPSGWFLTDSITWYKDGISLNASSDQFSFSYHPLTLEGSLLYQGYYSCSVDQVKAERMYSSKVLFKIPGIHTFVLSMQSQNENYIKDCVDFMLFGTAFSDYRNSSLHKCFKSNFKKTLFDSFHFHLRNITCNSSYADITIHVYYKEENENEEEILKKIQTADFLQFSRDCDFEPDSITLRSTVACYGEKTILNNESLTWPTTPIGEIAVPNELCLTDEGALLQRRCVGDFNTGAVWSLMPLTPCRNVESGVTQKLHQMLQNDAAVSFSPSSPLIMLTSRPQELLPADVELVTEILVQSASQQSYAPQNLASVAKAINNLMEVPEEILKQTSNSPNQIIESFEHIAHKIDTGDEVFQVAFENLAVSVQPLTNSSYNIPNCVLLPNWSQNLTTLFNASVSELKNNINGSRAGIVLPSALVIEKLKNRSDRVVYAVRQNINFVKNITVVSAVIQASFGDSFVYDVSPPVEMFFKINENTRENNRSFLKCVFWDQRLNNDLGGWSYKGCLLTQLESHLISCSCNHLTSFTVILELNPTPVLHIHRTALTLITYIGCSLSCFGLGVIILTFLFFREWRKSVKNKSLFNLSASLICFLLLFMTGVEKTNLEDWCIVIAVILHYLLLSSFAWMLVSAFLMYLSLVKVLATYIPCLIQKAMLFAYGMPAVIIIGVLSYKYQLYYQEKYCWLSQDAFYYAIASPILVMLTANFIIFGLILHANTCGKSKTFLRSNQDRRKLTIARAKALFCVSILLGLSWVFGFLAVGGAKIVFQYLFAITTTLQGFLCFIFFIVRQRLARQLWKGRLFPSSVEKSRISHITGSTVISNRIHRNTDINYETLFGSVIFKAHSPYEPYM